MRYVYLTKEQLEEMDIKMDDNFVAATKSTIQAIRSVRQGKTIKETLRERIEDIYRGRSPQELEEALDKFTDSGYISASSHELGDKSFYMEEKFRIKEAKFLKRLSKQELEDYAENLTLLSIGEKVKDGFNDHALNMVILKKQGWWNRESKIGQNLKLSLFSGKEGQEEFS